MGSFLSLPLLSICVVSFMTPTIALNTYTSDKDTSWRSTSPFVPSDSAQYGHIRFWEEMTVSLHIRWNSRAHTDPDTDRYEQILRVGWPALNGACNGENSRYPSLWIDDKEDAFHLSVSNEGNCGKGYTLDAYPIELGVTYALDMHFSENSIAASINDTLVLNTTRTAQL